MMMPAQSPRAAWIASTSTPSWLLCTARTSKPKPAASLSHPLLDLSQGGGSVDLGLPGAEHVEIRSVDEQTGLVQGVRSPPYGTDARAADSKAHRSTGRAVGVHAEIDARVVVGQIHRPRRSRRRDGRRGDTGPRVERQPLPVRYRPRLHRLLRAAARRRPPGPRLPSH